MPLTKEVKEACVYAMINELNILEKRKPILGIATELKDTFRPGLKVGKNIPAAREFFKSMMPDVKEALYQHDKAMLANENVTPDSIRYYNSYKHKYGIMERLILDKVLKKNPVYELLLLEAPDLIGTIN